MCYLSGSIKKLKIKKYAEFYFNQVKRYFMPARRNGEARPDEFRGRAYQRRAADAFKRFIFYRRVRVFVRVRTKSVYSRDLDECIADKTNRRHSGFNEREHRLGSIARRRRAGSRHNRLASNDCDGLIFALYFIFLALIVRPFWTKTNPVTFPAESFSNVTVAPAK